MKIFLLLIILIGIQQLDAQTHYPKQRTFAKQQTSNKRLMGNNYQTLSAAALLDSTKGWNWDTITLSWKAIGMTKNYVYDSQNRVTNYLRLLYNGTTWVNQNLCTTVYVNTVATTTVQAWHANTGTWVNSNKGTITYDANNNLISDLQQTWDTVNNIWVNEYRFNCTYNIANKQTSTTSLEWSNNAWYKTERYFYSYNANNIETAGSYQYWDYNTHALYDSSKYTKTLNANNDAVNYLEFMWNPYSLGWDSSLRATYTYDIYHNLLTDTVQTWSGISFTGINWVNGWESIFTYDANNNETSEIEHDWMTNTNTWFDGVHLFYTYDANGNQLSYVHKSSTLHPTWIGDSTYNYYRNITGIKSMSTKNEISIYPNPAQNNFTIETTASEKQILQVFDINGKIVLTQIVNNKTIIDASNFNAGVYNLNLISSASVATKKLVVVK